MDEIEIFLRVAFFGLAVILSLLAWMSYLRVRDVKLGFAAAGFAILELVGFLLVLGIFIGEIETYMTMTVIIGANLAVLIFFYLSIFKR